MQAGKYLGVIITPTLSWNQHIDSATKKANGSRAFLQRNLRKCPSNIKKLGYRSLVRPIIEYSSVVWDPHTCVAINRIEMVQRKAARFVCNDFSRHSSVTSMLHNLGGHSLERRRKEAKAVMMYRIANSLIAIPTSPYFLLPISSENLEQPTGWGCPDQLHRQFQNGYGDSWLRPVLELRWF